MNVRRESKRGRSLGRSLPAGGLVKGKKPDAEEVLRLVRSDFGAFCGFVYAGFKMPAHVELIVALLERMERGDVLRALLSLPPRHGKTTTACQLWPAWLLGRDPGRHVIFATHSSEYAATVGRKVRNLMMSERFLAAFPPRRSRTTRRPPIGSTCGPGAPISHWPRRLCDGPRRGFRDPGRRRQGHRGGALPAIRSAVKAWFSADIFTRLEPGARLLSVGTRWSLDDLPAYLEREHAHEEWTTLNLPALAEEGDVLGREVGEALWPARYGAARLKLIRLSKSAAEWNALYMGRPTPEGGAVFREEWLGQRFDFATFSDAGKIVQSWDCSVGKSATTGDYSACVTLARGQEGAFYVLDVVRGRWPYVELRERVRTLAAEWSPHEILIEDSSSGSAILQELRHDASLPPLRAVAAVKEKSLRWEWSAAVLLGPVSLCRGAAWLPDVIDELVTVPASAHDDMTDALAQAIEHLRGRGIRWTLQAVADWVASDKEAANAAPAAPSSKSTPPTAEGSPEPSRE